MIFPLVSSWNVYIYILKKICKFYWLSPLLQYLDLFSSLDTLDFFSNSPGEIIVLWQIIKLDKKVGFVIHITWIFYPHAVVVSVQLQTGKYHPNRLPKVFIIIRSYFTLFPLSRANPSLSEGIACLDVGNPLDPSCCCYFNCPFYFLHACCLSILVTTVLLALHNVLFFHWTNSFPFFSCPSFPTISSYLLSLLFVTFSLVVCGLSGPAHPSISS